MKFDKVKETVKPAKDWIEKNDTELALVTAGVLIGAILALVTVKVKEKQGSVITINGVDYDLPEGSNVSIKF